MTLLQVEYFLEAAKQESFTKAADNLYISHQALSYKIKALEKELDIELFERKNKRKLVLTEAGRILFQTWGPLLYSAKKSLQEAREADIRNKNTITIGVQDIVQIRQTTVDALQKWREKNPALNVKYVINTPAILYQLLEENEIDICSTFSYDFPNKEKYQSIVIGSKTFTPVIAVSRNNPLSKRKKLSLADLKNETLIMLRGEYAKHIENMMYKDFEEAGIEPKSIKTVDNFNEVEMALLMNQGVTIILDTLIENQEKQIKFYRFKASNKDFVNIVFTWRNPAFNYLMQLF